MKMAMQVAVSMPPMTAVPITLRATAPEPEAMARGTHPRIKAKEVMRIGRRRKPGAFQGRIRNIPALLVLDLGKLHDKNGVFGRQPDEHDEADLGIEVQFHVPEQDEGKGPEHGDGRSEEHAEGERPALVLGREDQENEKQRHPEDDGDGHALAGLLLLVGHADVIIAHLLGHRLFGKPLPGPSWPGGNCSRGPRMR